MKDASIKATPSGEGKDSLPLAGPTLHRFRFVEQAAADQTVLMEFRDPAPRKAVRASAALDAPPADSANPDPDALDIVAVPWDPRNDPRWRSELQNWVAPAAQRSALPPIVVKVGGAQITWCSGRALIHGAADPIEPLLAALVDFGYYEAELRRLELEVADSWPALEEDTPLAYDVTQADMARHKAVGRRMEQTLRRRMRHVRLEPHLYESPAHLPAAARDLGKRLREEARIEERLEVLDGQIEAYENVYELSSQRISEFRAARQGFILESVIIVLLAAETVLLLAELLWYLEP
jgi:hypothetical protein